MSRLEQDRAAALAASEASQTKAKRENALRDAAPELLEALQGLDDYVSNNISTDYPTGVDVNAAPFKAARAAIAKATGDTP